MSLKGVSTVLGHIETMLAIQVDLDLFVKCKAIESPMSSDENIEIVYIDFDIETLTVTVLIDGDKIDISFDSPTDYRVLNEGDLLEFWPSCLSFNSWFYVIQSGGWLDQERSRKGFDSSAKTDSKEYFIIGCNYCIDVLSWEAPSVCQSIR